LVRGPAILSVLGKGDGDVWAWQMRYLRQETSPSAIRSGPRARSGEITSVGVGSKRLPHQRRVFPATICRGGGSNFKSPAHKRGPVRKGPRFASSASAGAACQTHGQTQKKNRSDAEPVEPVPSWRSRRTTQMGYAIFARSNSVPTSCPRSRKQLERTSLRYMGAAPGRSTTDGRGKTAGASRTKKFFPEDQPNAIPLPVDEALANAPRRAPGDFSAFPAVFD